MRLLSSIVVLALGSAHAAGWEALPGALDRAVPHVARPGSAVARIINGVPTADHPAVAGLEIRNEHGVGLCSGTLVSPSVVLTAAHCVGTVPVEIWAVFFPDASTGWAYAAVAYAVHPEYRFPDADLAALLLEAPVAGIAPVPLVDRKPRSRTTGTIVGYGLDELGTVGQKQMGTVRLRRCPRRVPSMNLPRGALRRALCWRSRGWEQNTCKGDSGGPLLVGPSLAGVTSGGDPHCLGYLSWNTSVAPFLPWIRGLLR